MNFCDLFCAMIMRLSRITRNSTLPKKDKNLKINSTQKRIKIKEFDGF
ncbi:MAG: hypothetical protein J6V67_04400 [Campylobacter sp.]|nr:hypothetical protein [Campylobacter sp.]MBO7155113.1 hypothetical protein [Campylobacter sp.]